MSEETTFPDPLGVRARTAESEADRALCNFYYPNYACSIRTMDGAFVHFTIHGQRVTGWHETENECYAELAEKIRAWEKENPIQAMEAKCSTSRN
jgi:hypothetical protein